MGGISKTEQGEESALVRLLLLSFRCCMLQRQEGVLKGGVWKKRRKGERRRERECLGSTATAAAAACQSKRGKKDNAGGLPERKHFSAWFCKEKGLIGLMRKSAFQPLLMVFHMV